MSSVHDSLISLVEIKALAAKHLGDGSVAKSIIMSEKDTLPREEASAKIEIFMKLLLKELSTNMLA